MEILQAVDVFKVKMKALLLKCLILLDIHINNNIHFLIWPQLVRNCDKLLFDFAIIHPETKQVLYLIEYDGI